MFRTTYYLAQNLDVAEAINHGTLPSAIAHFITSGLTEGRAPSEYFAETYLKNNPDVAAAVPPNIGGLGGQTVQNGDFSSGIHHFLKHGFAEGRFKSDLLQDFETFYLSQNAEAAAAVANGTYANGLEYLVMVGFGQGANPFPQFETLLESFDETYYLANNLDVAGAIENGVFRSALQHYITNGMAEGRLGKAIADNPETDIVTGIDESAIVNPENANPEFDQLTGQPGTVDPFTLGDANQAYYLNSSDNPDGKEYAAIANFNPDEDIIQLHGSAADYQLAASPEGLPAGTAIYRINGEQNDLIALLQDVSSLNLEDGYFSFV